MVYFKIYYFIKSFISIEILIETTFQYIKYICSFLNTTSTVR